MVRAPVKNQCKADRFGLPGWAEGRGQGVIQVQLFGNSSIDGSSTFLPIISPLYPRIWQCLSNSFHFPEMDPNQRGPPAPLHHWPAPLLVSLSWHLISSATGKTRKRSYYSHHFNPCRSRTPLLRPLFIQTQHMPRMSPPAWPIKGKLKAQFDR